MLDFLVMLPVKLLFVDRIHSQSKNFVTDVVRTRLQVTQNLMTALVPFRHFQVTSPVLNMPGNSIYKLTNENTRQLQLNR